MIVRKLKAPDLFTFSKLLNKMGLRDEISDLLKLPEDGKTKEPSGVIVVKLVVVILENIYLAENEFYDFVSPIVDKTPEELKELELTEIKYVINEIIKDPGFISFFT